MSKESSLSPLSDTLLHTRKYSNPRPPLWTRPAERTPLKHFTVKSQNLVVIERQAYRT